MKVIILEKELVGKCKICQKNIYCNSGFIEGIVLEDKTLICFKCTKKQAET
jgi:hypothetical protein